MLPTRAAWIDRMRPLLGEQREPLFVCCAARPIGAPVDIVARQRALAGLQSVAADALRTMIAAAERDLGGGALADGDAIVVAVSGGAAGDYAPGVRLVEEGGDAAAALRRGRVVVLEHEVPACCDLLVPVFDHRQLALRALLAFRCAAVPPAPPVLALALQTAQVVAHAAKAEAAGVHFEGVIATIGHELRQPLSALVTALDLLERLQGRGTHALEVAQRQSRQLSRLVDAVLDASRLSRRRLVLAPRRVDLRDVVHGAVESVQGAIAARQQRLDLELPGRPVRCMADPARLQQVFVNLLTNANRYTPPEGGIALRVAVDARSIVVRVSDTGIGLDPGACDRIFMPFTQESTGVREGLGLGLAISRGIIEGHGGSIGAESAGVGRGSTFVVRLPAATRPARAGLTPPAGGQPRKQAR